MSTLDVKTAMIFAFDGISMLEYPYEGAKVIGFLDMYEKIYVYNKVGDWCFVGRRGHMGYVPASSIVEVVEGGNVL